MSSGVLEVNSEHSFENLILVIPNLKSFQLVLQYSFLKDSNQFQYH